MQTNPLNALNISHLVNKFRDGTTVIEVEAVERQFLGDDIELLHAQCHQLPHFLQNLFHRTADMGARDNRDGTV